MTADLVGIVIAGLLGAYCLALALNFRGAANYVAEEIWRPYLEGRRVDESDERAMLRGARFVGASGCLIAAVVMVALARSL